MEKDMSYQQKNVTVSLISTTLILVFFLVRLSQMLQNGNLIQEDIYRLWGIVIVLGIVVTIAGTILTHIFSAIIESIRTGKEDPYIEDIEDERDKLIDLRGTRVAYIVFSIGVLLSMLTMVLGQPPIVMFTLLIFFGIVAQITGDITRLVLYRRGF
jgi:hypothetical protein